MQLTQSDREALADRLHNWGSNITLVKAIKSARKELVVDSHKEAWTPREKRASSGSCR